MIQKFAFLIYFTVFFLLWRKLNQLFLGKSFSKELLSSEFVPFQNLFPNHFKTIQKTFWTPFDANRLKTILLNQIESGLQFKLIQINSRFGFIHSSSIRPELNRIKLNDSDNLGKKFRNNFDSLGLISNLKHSPGCLSLKLINYINLDKFSCVKYFF